MDAQFRILLPVQLPVQGMGLQESPSSRKSTGTRRCRSGVQKNKNLEAAVGIAPAAKRNNAL